MGFFRNGSICSISIISARAQMFRPWPSASRSACANSTTPSPLHSSDLLRRPNGRDSTLRLQVSGPSSADALFGWGGVVTPTREMDPRDAGVWMTSDTEMRRLAPTQVRKFVVFDSDTDTGDSVDWEY